jgi:hypothetical protein
MDSPVETSGAPAIPIPPICAQADVLCHDLMDTQTLQEETKFCDVLCKALNGVL